MLSLCFFCVTWYGIGFSASKIKKKEFKNELNSTAGSFYKLSSDMHISYLCINYLQNNNFLNCTCRRFPYDRGALWQLHTRYVYFFINQISSMKTKPQKWFWCFLFLINGCHFCLFNSCKNSVQFEKMFWKNPH